MKKNPPLFVRRTPLSFVCGLLAVTGTFAVCTLAFAATTPKFSQVINPGTLSVDIVDGTYASVDDPGVSLSDVPFSFACQSSVGEFGTATEQLYVQNPFSTDGAWTVTLAAADPTALWSGTDQSGATVEYDFNDPAGSGCDDGSDSDSVGGLLSVDTSGATVEKGICKNCSTSEISIGSSSSFEEGVTDSITLLSGSPESDEVGDWILRGITVEQMIPGEQYATDYSLDLVLSIQTS